VILLVFHLDNWLAVKLAAVMVEWEIQSKLRAKLLDYDSAFLLVHLKLLNQIIAFLRR